MLAWCWSCRRENQFCLLLKTAPSGYVYSLGKMHACTRIYYTFAIHGMHTHAYTYTAHTCVHIHWTHIRARAHTHTPLHTHVHELAHTPVHAHTHIHAHTPTCMHARMHTHSLKHTHTCAIDCTFPMSSCMLGWLLACAHTLIHTHTHMRHRSYIPHDFTHAWVAAVGRGCLSF